MYNLLDYMYLVKAVLNESKSYVFYMSAVNQD